MIIDVLVNGDTGEAHIRQKNEIVIPPFYLAAMTEKEYENKIKNQNKKKKEKKETDKKDFEIQTSLFINDTIIAEQIKQEFSSKFLVYYFDNGETEFRDKLEINGLVYVPISGEEVDKNVVKLPTGIEEYGTDEQLDNEIKKFVYKWLDIPSDVLQFAVWNIKRSWVYDRFHTLNYLRALGDTGQGKSRFLDTLGAIHYKPIATSGATTAAPIFRIIEKWRGTLIMDEADFQKSDESQDIIKIINQGYEKDKWIMRCDQNDASKIAFFDPFCPKIIATRKAFDDKAVESRCITQVMAGTSRQDIPYNINDCFYAESQRLRNMLLLWRFRNYLKINPDVMPDGFDFSNLEPRVKQVISSFVSLFANDLKQLEAFKDYIVEYQEALIDERKTSFDGLIVTAIAELIQEAGGIDGLAISPQDIIEKGQISDFKGNQLKPRALSNHLKSLGFGKLEIKRVENKTKRCLLLKKEHIETIFKRYGCYDVTIVTMLTESLTEKKLGDFDLSKNIACHNNDRNNRNTVTDMSENVTVAESIENNLIPHTFDTKHITYHKCSIETCQDCECNLDSYNQPYCKKHWEESAVR